MLRLLAFWAAVGFLLPAGARLEAQEKTVPRPVVRVTVTAAGGANEAFRPVIAEAVQYKLGQYGLEEQTGAAAADFLLDCRYSQAGNQMEIGLEWRERPGGKPAAAVQRQGRVDLVLDTLILEALDELLGAARDRIEERRARMPAPKPAEPAVPPVEPPIPGPGEPLPPGFSPPRFVLSVAAGSLMAVGAASYYFPAGAEALLRGDFLLMSGRGQLGLGVLTGVTFFQAQGATETSLNFLVPLGASVRYALQLGPRLNLLFQLGGGGALLLMSTETQGTLAKVLPFVRSGVGAEWLLGRRLGLALEAAYEVFFETPYLIMGFAPSLSLCWRM